MCLAYDRPDSPFALVTTNRLSKSPRYVPHGGTMVAGAGLRSILVVGMFYLTLVRADFSNGALVILNQLDVEQSFRQPPAFQTDDLAGRGVSNSDPNAFINPIERQALPPEYASTNAGDYMLSNDLTPILDFEITAGRRARFGGGALLWNTHGDMNPLVSKRNLSRLTPDSVKLRFWTKGDSFQSSTPYLTTFNATFDGANGFGSGAIQTQPEFALALKTDIGLERAPMKGDVLGTVNLTASGRSPSGTSGTWKSDAYVSLAVVDPVIQTASPMRQGGPWGNTPYAANELRAYMETLPVDSVERTTLAATQVNYTLAKRGCAIASYAAAINALDIGISKTTKTLHDDLERAGLISRVDGVSNLNELIAGTQVIPKLTGANVSPESIMRLFPNQVYVRPANSPDQIVKAIGSGLPVLLNIGGPYAQHWVLAKNAYESGGLLVGVFDPGRSDGSKDIDYVLAAGLSARIVSDTPDLGGILSVQSPLSVKVTDPLGNTVVFDPQAGIVSSDIAGAYFERLGPLISPEDAYAGIGLQNPGGYLPTLLYLPNLSSGDYQFEAIGLDNGHFEMTFDVPGAGGVRTRVLEQSGDVLIGQSISYSAKVVVPEPKAIVNLVLGVLLLVANAIRGQLPDQFLRSAR